MLSHVISNNYPDYNTDEAFKNYCRNPLHDKYGPFCFYKKGNAVRKERCAVSICALSDEMNEIYMAHTGYIKTKTMLSRVADGIILYVFPIILFCGTFLNGLSIKVFRQPELRKSLAAFLLIILAVTDTLALCTILDRKPCYT